QISYFADPNTITGSSTLVFATSTGILNFYGVASSTEVRTPSGTIAGFSFTNATGSGNLQAATLRSTGNTIIDGRLAVGTTTFTAAVNIASSTNAAGGVAGIFEDLTINPAAADGFQFGNRMIVRASTTATTTAIGQLIRMIDNTSLGNTIRGLEVQAHFGTNNQGVNTAIVGYGRTFGMQGITTGEAGGVAQPAGVYGELQNGTQGNAIRAYSSTSTSATLVQFYQETSAFTGAGLLMNFGNGIGSFTGNFMNLQRASTTKFAINATGTVVIASSSAAAGSSSTLTVCAQTNCVLSSTSSASVVWVASVDGTTSTNSIVALGSIVGNAADFGEYVPVVGSSTNYEAGDLLSITSSSALFAKSSGAYDANLTGAISGGAAFIGGLEGGSEEKVVLTLAGRILVKVNGEGGSVRPGDFITASGERGVGMRATRSGRAVGMALEGFEAASATSTGKILVLIQPQWYVPEISADTLQGGSSGTGPALNTYTFDPELIYSFENLKVQNLELGSSERPSGITIYDVSTKNPYCVIVENGVLKSVPGKCGEGVTTNIIDTGFPTSTNSNSTPPTTEPAPPAPTPVQEPAPQESSPSDAASSTAPAEPAPQETTSTLEAPAEPLPEETPANTSSSIETIAPAEPQTPEPATSTLDPATETDSSGTTDANTGATDTAAAPDTSTSAPPAETSTADSPSTPLSPDTTAAEDP
ncbi:MAG: hypothetical protein UY96_C0006G0001, partial [Parcubacteria group bacterium GW2011_GWB1_56_8]